MRATMRAHAVLERRIVAADVTLRSPLGLSRRAVRLVAGTLEFQAAENWLRVTRRLLLRWATAALAQSSRHSLLDPVETSGNAWPLGQGLIKFRECLGCW